MTRVPAQFTYTKWRHGGWYVQEVRYPNGAVGCVSRNFPDKKWRIVCHPESGSPQEPTFTSRDAAALAEFVLAADQVAEQESLRGRYAVPAEPVPATPPTEARYLGSVCDNW